jgi:transcriptional regulator with XRE-family HTH domain
MSDEKSRAEARSTLQSAVDRSSLREVASEIGISHATLHDFLRERTPPTDRTLRLIQGWIDGAEGFDTTGGETLDEWTETALRTARFTNGEGHDDAEKRRIQRDILVGCIRLGLLEGRDVRVLEEKLAELGVPPEPARGTASLMAFYDRESRAAEIRAEGARELSIAARIEAEEARGRRMGVSEPITEVEPALRALHAARAAVAAEQGAPDATVQPPAGPPPAGGSGGTSRPQPRR